MEHENKLYTLLRALLLPILLIKFRSFQYSRGIIIFILLISVTGPV